MHAPPEAALATDPTLARVPPPGEQFNFADYPLRLNLEAGRAHQTAFRDDQGALSYGALDDRVRRLAAALRAAGLRREERVLLLMTDCNDWPVSFLGALYAGFVPVAVPPELQMSRALMCGSR